MHVTVEYTDEVETPFEEGFFLRVAERTLSECQFSFLENKTVNINVVMVAPEKIQALNKDHLGKDAVTDVLSFGEYNSKEELAAEKKKEVFLGELYLCTEFIEAASREDQVTFEREMVYIFSHGILHLVGFDHEEAMFTTQEGVTDFFTGEKRVY